jgi:drug/metabolite transporter (DMT)-like permease
MRPTPSGDRLTILAWLGIVLCGGSNAVAIRLGNAELPPFWGAALRFGLAAAILLPIVAARRPSLPQRREWVGVLLFGLTAFAGSYAALYWGLQEAPAPTAMVVIASVPLLTLLIAVTIGLERLSLRGVVGAVIALAGIAVVVGDQLSGAVPVTSLLALFIGAVFIAVSGVVVKRFPPGDPLVANAIGMSYSAVLLTGLAAVAGEPLTLPTTATTWATAVYLAVVGSIGLFMLILYVLARWTASSTSYATLVMPLVTIVGAMALLGESVGPPFIVGSIITLVGVYVGVSAGHVPQGAPASSVGDPVVGEGGMVDGREGARTSPRRPGLDRA